MARKPKARGNGEGSAYRDKHGQWWAQLTVDVDTGKLARRRAKSKTDALEKLRDLQSKHRTGVQVAGYSPTVEAWCDLWIEKWSAHLRPHIRDDYADVFLHYVKGSKLGRKPLNRTTNADVQAWLNGLRRADTDDPRPLAPRTLRNVHARLRSALGRAVKEKLIGANPADDVSLPRPDDIEVVPLNAAQIEQLLTHADAHRLQALWHLAIYTGMRQAEITGLRWADVDLERHALYVGGQLQRTRAGRKRLAPKTPSGRRTIQLGPTLAELLAEHRARQAKEHPEAGYVFVTASGAPYDNSNLWRQFQRLLARAKLRPMRFHDLRHTAASLMLAEGYTDGEVASILGHRDSSLIRKLYGHIFPERTAPAVDTLARRFSKRKASGE